MITDNKEAINTVYNVAFGERNTLKDLVELLKKSLTEFDPKIKDIQIIYGPNRVGDIPHSLASIDKAKKLLAYNPQFSLEKGLKEAVNWYWNNL
jgi:UDP-N-acetylglucosamine 4-epimerase